MWDLAVGHLSVVAWVAAIGVALFAGIVHGYSGFGGALLMVPVLSLFIDPAQAVAATTTAAVLGQLALIGRAARTAHWTECGPFLLGAGLLMPAGTYVLAVSNADTLRKLVGLSTLIASGVLLTGWAYRGVRRPVTSALFGALSGAVNGATAQGGPFAVAYFIAAPTTADVQRANIITVIAVQIGATLVAFGVSGILTGAVIVFGLALSLPHLAGIWAGNRLFSFVPRQNYKRVTVLLMMVAGLIALLR